MSHTRLPLGDAARERILAGATALADAVRVTLGPKSTCIVVERKWGAPLVCNDGVTIAKAVDLEDPEANVGVRLMREAAENTDDSVGAARQVLGPARAWVRPLRERAVTSPSDDAPIVREVGVSRCGLDGIPGADEDDAARLTTQGRRSGATAPSLGRDACTGMHPCAPWGASQGEDPPPRTRRAVTTHPGW